MGTVKCLFRQTIFIICKLIKALFVHYQQKYNFCFRNCQICVKTCFLSMQNQFLPYMSTVSALTSVTFTPYVFYSTAALRENSSLQTRSVKDLLKNYRYCHCLATKCQPATESIGGKVAKKNPPQTPKMNALFSVALKQ